MHKAAETGSCPGRRHMRDRAQTVIVGSGIVGASAAYHLAELGQPDVLVLDQGPLFATCGAVPQGGGGDSGRAGAGPAYPRAELGQPDVLVLDQGPLFATGGSTSH